MDCIKKTCADWISVEEHAPSKTGRYNLRNLGAKKEKYEAFLRNLNAMAHGDGTRVERCYTGRTGTGIPDTVWEQVKKG
jgi:hypothetical protein